MLNLTKYAIDWINGELLGDASIELAGPAKARFRYCSQYVEYINYVCDTLQSFGIIQTGKIYERIQGAHHSYSYCSHSYTELFACLHAWYPNGKKVVPRCITLSPITCRQWYIGDGCLVTRQHVRRKAFIELYTNAFPILDVDWLVEQLWEIGILATRKPTRNVIHISSVSVSDFLNYITGSPVECYRYKWDTKSTPKSLNH